MELILIAALAANSVIGRDEKIPWHIPEDLQRFKKLTTGNTVLMGRTTYDSIIGRLGKPLPKRNNVVLTRNPDFRAAEGVVIAHSIDEALRIAGSFGKPVYVIGGQKVYEQTIGRAKKMELTEISKEYKGDAYFPRFSMSDWRVTERMGRMTFSFVTYERG